MSAIPQTTEEIRAAVQARAIEIQGPAEEETTPQPRRPLQVDLSQFSGIRYLREYPPAFDWLLDKSFRLNSLGALVGQGLLCDPALRCRGKRDFPCGHVAYRRP